MLVDGSERRQITMHLKEDGSMWSEPNFELDEPMPWRAEVDWHLCARCFPPGEASAEEIEGFEACLDKVHAQISLANQAWVFDRIALGESTMTKAEVVKAGRFGTTHLEKLIRERRLPQPVVSSGRNLWLGSEVRHALAKIAADDTATARVRKTPLNRHQK